MADRNNFTYIVDPLRFQRIMWPHIQFYDRERELIYSVQDNRDTVCVAGNMLGKDFTAAFIALWFFLTRYPCRVITTSVDEMQLNGVLWGEIRNLIQSARFPLEASKGGPLLVNDLEIRRVYTNGPLKGKLHPKSYLRGRVAKKGEGLLGHHVPEVPGEFPPVPRTLFIADEASGVDDVGWDAADSWAHRRLAIGNPFPCENFFHRAVEGGSREDGTKEKPGDVERPTDDPRPGKLRKVITITAEDSPNVKYARAQIAAGMKPTGEVIVPGVMPWFVYQERLKTWPLIRQSIGLHAKFWKGADVLLYPPHWTLKAEEWADWIDDQVKRGLIRRAAEGMGVDPAEGGDYTVWTIVDRYGVMKQLSHKTPNTAVIPSMTIAMMREFDLAPELVCFDRGNGLQHADALREKGYGVRTVAFGEPIATDPKRSKSTLSERLGIREQRYSFKNRRAQLYGTIRELIDPSRLEAAAALTAYETMKEKRYSEDGVELDRVSMAYRATEIAENTVSPTLGGTQLHGFGIGREYGELHRQMSPIPLKIDAEGRTYMIPKDKPNPNYKGQTLKSLLGRSPDELDSLALAIHAMLERPSNAGYAGGF